MVNSKLGEGLEAQCWFCNETFVKNRYHEVCGLWECPHCGKCGCDLDPFTKQAVEKTYLAFERARWGPRP